MAIITLNQGEQSTISNNGDVVRGRQGGQETILIPNNVTGIETNAEIERADLALELSDLSFQVTSNGFEISDGSNPILTIPSLNQELDLRLANGNLSLSQTGAQEFTVANPNNPNDSAAIGTNAFAGSDLQVGLGNDISATVPGDELVEGDDEANELTPDSSESSFQTSDLNETIRGFDGDDTIDGSGGDDTIEAGDDNDFIAFDAEDSSVDGEAGFDQVQLGEVADATIGSNNDDISLQPLENVQLIDTTSSQGGNTFDLSNLLVDSITGGEDTFGVLENNLAFLTGSEVDEIDVGDISAPSGNFQVGAEAPTTIQVIRSQEAQDANATPDINNPNNAKVVVLNEGENAEILTGDGFDVPDGSISNPTPSYYIGTDADETVTAEFNNLSDSNGFGNDTLAAADGEDTLAFENNLPGDLTQQLGPLAFVSGFETLDLENASVNNTLTLNNQVLGQLSRGEPTVQGADTLKVVTASGGTTEIDTQGTGADDTVIVEGGAFNLADQRSGSNLLQGNLITIADEGAGVITGGNGNDSINGGTADDVIDLRPTQGNTESGNNVVSGGAGEDFVAAGADDDSLNGGEDDDRFAFEIDPDTEVSRLDSQDTVNGGIGQEDTLALAANTRLDSLSEIDNVTRIEVIELNGNSTDTDGDDNPLPVLNELTLTNNVVTTADSTLTVDASAPGDVDQRGDRPGEVKAGFDLVESDSEDKLNDSLDNNLIDLFFLDEDVDTSVEGGNAHDRIIFSDQSFSGNQTINGGDGDIETDIDSGSAVGLPVPEIEGTEFDAPQDTPTEVFAEKTSVTNEQRLDLVDGISNFDTLEFRAEGGQPFTAVSTDYDEIRGFEEIQLSNSVPNTNSNFEITLNNDIVRQLTQTTSAGSTTQGQPVNLNVSLDQIEEIGQSNVTAFSGRQIGQDSTVELVTAGLVDSLNTVTVQNPNGVDTVIENIIGSPETITAEDLIGPDGGPRTARVGRVNVSPSDLITTAELAAANGDQITQEYQLGEALELGDPSDPRPDAALPTVVVTVGHNFQETPAELEFSANNVNHQVITGDGDFVITTAQGDDTITPGSGDDEIFTGEGDDTIFLGAGGDDTVDGGADTDTVSFRNADEGVTVSADNFEDIEIIVGSDFDDNLTGNDDDNFIDGAAGDDNIEGLEGDDTLLGGAGEDELDGGEGEDSLFGDVGSDGDDTLVGGEDDDVLVGEFNDDSLEGGNGDDELFGDREVDPETLTINTLTPKPANNEVAGEDTLEGGAGEDTLFGGAEDDTLDGGDDNDELFGEADDDSLVGGAGLDTLEGGAGEDTLDGREDGDELFGNDGDDTVVGSTGDDTIDGGEADETDGDTLDYNELDSEVTLLSLGQIAKGGRTLGTASDGVDQLASLDPDPSIETIVGDEDFNADNVSTPTLNGVNTIDGRNGEVSSFANANLSTDTLAIDFNDDGTVPAEDKFTIENFVNIFGTNNGDTIVGDEQNNVIAGSGIVDNNPTDGETEVDSLEGNAGNDQFLFVEDKDFADTFDNPIGNDGSTNGRVEIVDFQPGSDQLVLDVGTNSANRTTTTTMISAGGNTTTATVTTDNPTGSDLANAVAGFASGAFTGMGDSINVITGGSLSLNLNMLTGMAFSGGMTGGFADAVQLEGFAFADTAISNLEDFNQALFGANVSGLNDTGFLAFGLNNTVSAATKLFYATGTIVQFFEGPIVEEVQIPEPIPGGARVNNINQSGSVTLSSGNGIQASDIFLV